MLKIGKTFILMSILAVWSSLSYASEWSTIHEFSGARFEGKLSFHPSRKEIKLYYKSKRNWGDFLLYGPVKVDSPERVNEAYAELESFFKRQLFRAGTAEEILNSIDQIRYLSGVGCQAIFVSGQNPIDGDDKSKEGGIADLYNKITLIAESSRLSIADKEAFRSLLIDEYSTSEGQIQLRMLLNKNSDFLKFSFTKPQGDMKGFKVSLSEGEVGLRSPASDDLLTLDAKSFDGESGLLIVHYSDQDSAFAQRKSYLRLEREGGDWQINRFSREDFQETRVKEGVALSSFTAEHESVIQLEQNGISFARIKKDEFEAISFLFEGGHVLLEDVEHFYNECMAEELTYRKSQNNGILDQRGITLAGEKCKRVAAIELFFGKAQQQESEEAARSCLMEKGLIIPRYGFYELSYGEDMVSGLKSCHDLLEKVHYEDNFITNMRAELPSKLRGMTLLEGDSSYLKILELIRNSCDGDECYLHAKQASAHLALRSYVEGAKADIDLENDECIKMALLNIEQSKMCSKKYYIDVRIRELGKRTPHHSIVFEKSLRKCFYEHLQGEEDILDVIERDDYFVENCFNKSLIPLAQGEITDEVLERLRPLTFMLPPEEQSLIKETLEDLALKALGEEGLKKITSQLKEEIINELMVHGRKMSEGRLQSQFEAYLESADILTEQRRELLVEVRRSFDRAQDVFKSTDLIHLSRKEQRTSLNGFSKSILLDYGMLKTQAEVAQGVLYEKDAETIANRVNGELKSCMDTFFSNQAYPIEKKWLECEKKRQGDVAQEMMRRLYTQEVSEYFSLTSVMANDILSPLSYFDDCINLQSKNLTMKLVDFKKHLISCEKVVKFDIGLNLSRARLDEYAPLLKDKKKQREKLNSCYRDIIKDTGEGFSGPLTQDEKRRSLFDYKRSLISRSPYGNSFLGVLTPSLNIEPEFYRNDKENVKLLLRNLSERQTDDNWEERLSECANESVRDTGESFREYMITNIPSLEIIAHGDQYEALMRDFLDVEMVELLLSFKGKLIGMSENSGVLALKNFMDTLSTLLDDGFVYDQEQTKTELIIFKNELKGFLRWAKSNPHGVSLNEASEFFQESQLGEHLTLAVLSQKTFESFEKGLLQMKQDELGRLYRRAGCHKNQIRSCLNSQEREVYRRILRKYRSLLMHTKKMTSSYDFRRIIRPDSSEGEELLGMIKEIYLKPKIIGTGVSLRAQEKVMELVGEAILKDNTSGGFADLFVQEAAQFQLDSERDQRWAITKYFFFDGKDFDWEVLKQTAAGERAISYYSRYIMLPQFMGQQQSATMKRLRREQFRRLLTDAQAQNHR